MTRRAALGGRSGVLGGMAVPRGHEGRQRWCRLARALLRVFHLSRWSGWFVCVQCVEKTLHPRSDLFKKWVRRVSGQSAIGSKAFRRWEPSQQTGNPVSPLPLTSNILQVKTYWMNSYMLIHVEHDHQIGGFAVN